MGARSSRAGEARTKPKGLAPRSQHQGSCEARAQIRSPEGRDVVLSHSNGSPEHSLRSLTGRTRNACEQEDEWVNAGLHQ